MIVLSLFDGIGVGLAALKAAGIKVDLYMASEVDKDAISVCMSNHPEVVQVGRVANIRHSMGQLHTENGWFPLPDLIMGGSPCTGFAAQGKMQGFADPRSMLFWHFSRIVNECKPKHVFLENIKMKTSWEDIISNEMKLNPKHINSAVHSAQSRPRVYWMNWEADVIHSSVSVRDIVEGYIVAVRGRYVGGKTIQFAEWRKDDKSNCLTTVAKDNMVAPYPRFVKTLYEDVKSDLRKLTRRESELLQSLPSGYTSSVSESKARKLIGKSWNLKTIKELLLWLPT